MRTDGKVRRSIHRGGATSLLLALAVAAGCSNEPTEPPPGFEEQPGNQAPVANAGADQTVSARMTALLNGSASTDADGDDLAFSWTIVGPEGSTAEPNTPTARTTTFVPDVPGEYVATLIVDDGMETHSATVTITAEDNTIRQTVGTEGGRLESDEFGFILDPVVADLLGPTVLSVTTATEAQREAAIFEEELELALGGSADLFGRPDAAWRVEVEAEDGSDGGADLSWVFTHRAEELLVSSRELAFYLIFGDDADPTAWFAERSDGELRYVGMGRGSKTIVRLSPGPDDAVRLEAPATVEVGVPFDGTIVVDSGEGDLIVGVALDEASILPVEPSGMFVNEVPLSDGSGSIANRYVCVSRGSGVVAVETTPTVLGVNGEPYPLPTLRLSANVTCTEPEEEEEPLKAAFSLPVNRVTGGLADPHSPRVHVAGEFSSRVLDWESQTITNTGVDFGSRLEFGAGMSDGATMYVTELGRWSLYDADGGALTPDVPINATQLNDLDHIEGNRWIATSGTGDIFGVEYNAIDESLGYEGFDVIFGAGDSENIVAVEVLDGQRALGILDDPGSESRKLVLIDGLDDLSSPVITALTGSPSIARSDLRFLGAGLECAPSSDPDVYTCGMFSKQEFAQSREPDTAPFFLVELDIVAAEISVLHEGVGAYAGLVPEYRVTGTRILGVAQFDDRLDQFDVDADGSVTTSSQGPYWSNPNGYAVGGFLPPTPAESGIGIWWGASVNDEAADAAVLEAFLSF